MLCAKCTEYNVVHSFSVFSLVVELPLLTYHCIYVLSTYIWYILIVIIAVALVDSDNKYLVSHKLKKCQRRRRKERQTDKLREWSKEKITHIYMHAHTRAYKVGGV